MGKPVGNLFFILEAFLFDSNYKTVIDAKLQLSFCHCLINVSTEAGVLSEILNPSPDG